MDKNTIIGFALIGALVIGFNWFNQPSPEQIAEAQKQEQLAKAKQIEEQKKVASQAAVAIAPEQPLDSAALAALPEYKKPREARTIELKNEKLLFKLNSKGAELTYAEVKGYDNHKDGYDTKKFAPVALMKGDDSYFNIPLKTLRGETINTHDATFEVVSSTDSTAVLRLPLSADAYLDFNYHLRQADYRLELSISGKGAETVLAANPQQALQWKLKLPQQEQSHRFEGQYSSLYYGQTDGTVDDLSSSSKSEEHVKESLRWFAFKDKYFSSVLIKRGGTFESSNLSVEAMDEKSGYVRAMDMRTAFDYKPSQSADFTFYFGPNDYNTLKGYDEGVSDLEQLHLDHLVYLGWSVFRSINKWLIIPIVDFLKNYIGSWGIIILILTVFIKTLLFPFTYKSQVSQAKMRVLKPQVDEINKKYEGKTDQESALKKQKETFALYSTVGASPMSGCLPMLLQMPFLIALYMYFPTSVYLRGQSFLWAADLSTYDPVISWDFNIPIIGSLLGNHISLFCLLMSIVNIIYNRYMMSQSSAPTGDAAASMKYMPYMMTIMFFFMFNQNASGLSYYYFVTTLISIIQFFIIRATINDDEILNQMEENRKNPKKKKGESFLERLERMQREQAKAKAKK